jgi:hypothetical protein
MIEAQHLEKLGQSLKVPALVIVGVLVLMVVYLFDLMMYYFTLI